MASRRGRPKGSVWKPLEARIFAELIVRPREFEDLYASVKGNKPTFSRYLKRLVTSGLVTRRVLPVKGHHVQYAARVDLDKLWMSEELAQLVFRARSHIEMRQARDRGTTMYVKGMAQEFVKHAWIRVLLQREVLSRFPRAGTKRKLWMEPKDVDVVSDALTYYTTQLFQQEAEELNRKMAEPRFKLRKRRKPSEARFRMLGGRMDAHTELAAELRLVHDMEEHIVCRECFLRGDFVFTQEPEPGVRACPKCAITYTAFVEAPAESAGPERDEEEHRMLNEPLLYGIDELGSNPRDERVLLEWMKRRGLL